MVKPNELRIGNLLRYVDNNQYVRIKTIGENDCRVEFIVGPTGQEKTVAYDALKGIVLTPDRLKFLGFKNTYDHYYSSNQAYLELKLVDVDFWVWTGSNEAIGKRFNDVHQLQNIFFALMHYELEFTLQDA